MVWNPWIILLLRRKMMTYLFNKLIFLNKFPGEDPANNMQQKIVLKLSPADAGDQSIIIRNIAENKKQIIMRTMQYLTRRILFVEGKRLLLCNNVQQELRFQS